MPEEINLDDLTISATPPKPVRTKAPPAVLVAEEAPKKTTVRIILDESEDIPPCGLFLQHNGRSYMLRTGLEVDVPMFIKEILDHAIISTPIVNPQTRQVTGYRSRPKHTYRVVA